MQCRRSQFDSWDGKIPWRRDRLPTPVFFGFPGDSDGKESTCNAGDLGLIPGLGRSPEEGIGYPHQYSSASLVTQMVKNLRAMQETWVWTLGWEDPLKEGMATHSSILAQRIHMAGWQTTVHGVAKSHNWVTKHSTVTGLSQYHFFKYLSYNIANESGMLVNV